MGRKGLKEGNSSWSEAFHIIHPTRCIRCYGMGWQRNRSPVWALLSAQNKPNAAKLFGQRPKTCCKATKNLSRQRREIFHRPSQSPDLSWRPTNKQQVKVTAVKTSSREKTQHVVMFIGAQTSVSLWKGFKIILIFKIMSVCPVTFEILKLCIKMV